VTGVGAAYRLRGVTGFAFGIERAQRLPLSACGWRWRSILAVVRQCPERTRERHDADKTGESNND